MANDCSGSTTWEWKLCRVRPSSARTPESVGAAVRVPGSSPDPRKAHWVKVTYLGGSEAWWQLELDGVLHRVPGHLCLHDAMSAVLRGKYRARRR